MRRGDARTTWLGVDVGGPRKGFDVALVDDRAPGIRWTPDEASVRASEYYGWILHGLALHDALAASRAEVIEVFPTASWTRWHGARGARSRSAWTREGLRALNLAGVPEQTNQDQRDAIAAAVTARLHTQGLTEMVGDIAIPAPRTG